MSSSKGKKRRRPPSDEGDLRQWLDLQDKQTKKSRIDVSPRHYYSSELHKAAYLQDVSDTYSALSPAEQFDFGRPGPSRVGFRARSPSLEYNSLRTVEEGSARVTAGPSTPFVRTSTPDLHSSLDARVPRLVSSSFELSHTASSRQRRRKRTRYESFNSERSSSPKRVTERRGGRPHSRMCEGAPRQVGKCDPFSSELLESPVRVLSGTDSFRDVLGLRGLSQLHPEKIVVHIHEQEWEHFCRFLRSTYSCCSNTQLPLFVSIMSKVGIASSTVPNIRPWANDILAELSSTDCIPFWGSLAVLIRKLPYLQKSQSNFACDILRLAQVLLQSEGKELYIPYLPLDDLYSSASQNICQSEESKEFEKLVGDVIEERNKIRQTMKENEDDQDSSTNHVVVLPTPAELMHSTISSKVEKNVVKGQYRSPQHYLQLHCNLLREDFVYPLRCALHKVQKEEEEEGRDVKIYKKVTLEGTDVTNAGLVYLIHFFLPKRKRVNWEHSKRLLYGALVCLSSDQFVNVTFATVANRKLEDLREGLISLRFIGHQPISGLPINPKMQYKMIESPGYFEAFAPVISCLTKRARECDSLPFIKYLVSCDTNVSPPLYLSTKANALMNIKGITCSCETATYRALDDMDFMEEPSESRCGLDAIQILNKEMWDMALQSCNSTRLDESQMVALYTALVNELALIQGPPGTGKTYIGIKLVEILLRNRKLWQRPRKSPITVMCYTNHALDQFLQGILDVPNLNARIFRVGGRSKNERINSLNVMRAMPRPKRKGWSPKMLPELQAKIQALKDLCRGTFNDMNKALYYLFLHPEWVLDHQEYFPVIQAMQIKSRTTSPEEIARQMFFQLGIEVQKQENADHQQMVDEEDLDIFRLYQHKEDDRQILDDTFKTYERDWMYKLVSVGELRRFVNSLQYIQPVVYTKEQQFVQQEQMIGILKQCLISLLGFYNEQHEHLSEKKAVHAKEDDESMARILREADIVGFTTTGAAKFNKVVSKLKSKILIVEEAAEVLEAHIIAALTNYNEHLILIGDHKQLRPKTNDSYLGTQYGLEVSLFERLVNNGFQCATLAYQHRMRPEISELIHPHIYPNLKDHDSVLGLSDIRGIKQNLYFISHVQPETDNEDLRSPSNVHEANFLSSLCNYLIQQGYSPQKITVLTPYSGQVVRLKNAFRKYHIRGVRIVPVDHFQGEENDIILLSLVRSLKPGFVKVDNRVCVSLSRARKGFYCIGNFQLFSKYSKLWENILTSVHKKRLIGNMLSLQCQLHNNETMVSSSEDFNHVPDGGCSNDCGFRLNCGHICPRKCHPDDPDHLNPCEKPCTKLCTNGLHYCQGKCYQPYCPPCKISVMKVLPVCGHDQMMPCFVDPSERNCQEPCPLTLPCGHRCQSKCGKECTVDCNALVKRMWPCGHEAQKECYVSEGQYMTKGHCKIPCNFELSCGHLCSGTCGKCRQGRLHVPCKQKCKRVLLCGHPCTSTCSATCPPCRKKCPTKCVHGACGNFCNQLCIKCQERCKWTCKHFSCSKPCGEVCDRPVCNSPCLKRLKCKHACLGLCGEPCPPICRECDPEHEAFQVFLGNEAEPDARFIQLQDCKCVFEVRDIDRYMDMSPVEGDDVKVQWKKCPRCSVIISATQRYSNYIKRTKSDMNKIKTQQNKFLDAEVRSRISEEVFGWSLQYEIMRILKLKSANAIEKLSDHTILKEHIVLHAIDDARIVGTKMKQICAHLSALARSPRTNTLIAACKSLQGQVVSFLDFLEGDKCRSFQQLPEQVDSDIHAEQNRLVLISKLYMLQAEIICREFPGLNAEEQCFITRIIAEFDPRDGRIRKPMDQEKYSELVASLKTIVDSHPELKRITEKERREIVKAMGGQKGSWYKCRNGHYYQIGECGGAMTTGRCIECRETVGGSHHRLRDDNAHAPEMDGSRYPAWSEQANMENYDF